MDLKTLVRHMGNAFLNFLETSQEDIVCFVLQIPITRMSRQVLFQDSLIMELSNSIVIKKRTSLSILRYVS